jgi:hypothetical protein
MIKNIIINIIKIYQKTLSPDHSVFFSHKHPAGYCKYYPSCSEYSLQAFKKYNLTKAFLKTITRIIRCNPFSKGGIDHP